jgi:hypothetical protein
MTQKTTHDQMVETLTQPYKEPSKDSEPTTYDINAARYVEKFHSDPAIKEIVDVISAATELSTIKRALAGD